MSQLIVQPGNWDSFSSAEVESFLTYVAILLGLTEKKTNFLIQVHKDIHGQYALDEYYKKLCKILANWPPRWVLQKIMEDCNANQKKQLKIWYQELISMEPMDEHKSMIMLSLLPLSKVIDTF